MASIPLLGLAVIPFWQWLAKPEKEDKGVVQVLYRTRSTRRHPFAAVRGPRMGEILGNRELSRRRASAVKIGLLALESAVLAGIAATYGTPLLPASTDGFLWILLVALSVFPGAFLLVAGAVARTSGRWARFAFLADHPYGAFLTFLPLAPLLGVLAGTWAGSDNLRLLLITVGFAGILTTLLAMMWTFLFSLFFGVPERSSTGIAICFSLSILFMLLALNPPIRLLAVLTALASPLAGIMVASRWLAPFRLRDLNDRRLPAHLRTRLWALAATAILPLGGLAVPAWIRMRHRHGSELDQWAAQLREPAA